MALIKLNLMIHEKRQASPSKKHKQVLIRKKGSDLTDNFSATTRHDLRDARADKKGDNSDGPGFEIFEDFFLLFFLRNQASRNLISRSESILLTATRSGIIHEFYSGSRILIFRGERSGLL